MHGIGGVPIPGRLLLAPMAGVTDVGFRSVCRREGAALCCTEMVSSKALVYQDGKTLSLLAMEPGEHPVAVQLYNHWRKHLLGAYWQRMGMTVIPSICWSDESSFDWCFDGEPAGGTVAVSSVGTQKNPNARQLFQLGYSEMLRRLKPEKILFFGDMPENCKGNLEHHPAYYAALAHARKKR